MRIDIGKYTAEAPAKARALYKKLGRNAKKFAREDLHSEGAACATQASREAPVYSFCHSE
jgi:hypothetical protein